MNISPDDATGHVGGFGPRTDALDLSQGEDTPWPLREVLSTLVEATEHLLNAHACDVHGHERFAEACRVAKQFVARDGDRRGGGA